MNAIFDAIGNDFEKFIAAAEEVFPDFKKKMESKLKEDVDAELLQEEQNLAEDIDRHTKLLNEYEDKLDSLKNEYDILNKKASTLSDDLHELVLKREEIHKKWIALHPTTVRPMKLQAIIPDKIVDDPTYVKKPNFHLAFNAYSQYARQSLSQRG